MNGLLPVSVGSIPMFRHRDTFIVHVGAAQEHGVQEYINGHQLLLGASHGITVAQLTLLVGESRKQ